MSLFDYRRAQELAAEHENVHAMLMACVLRGDSQIQAAIKAAMPDVYAETYARYNAPGGLLVGEQNHEAGFERREDGLYSLETGEQIRAL